MRRRSSPTTRERAIFEVDPFVSIDRDGVGELVRIGTERGRKVRPDLKVGICGEHGGDPASIAFCHATGPRLRVLLAVPRAGGAPRRRAGRDQGEAQARLSWPRAGLTK